MHTLRVEHRTMGGSILICIAPIKRRGFDSSHVYPNVRGNRSESSFKLRSITVISYESGNVREPMGLWDFHATPLAGCASPASFYIG